MSRYVDAGNGEYPYGIEMRISDGQVYRVSYKSESLRNEDFYRLIRYVDDAVGNKSMQYNMQLSELEKIVKRIDNRIKKWMDQ